MKTNSGLSKYLTKALFLPPGNIDSVSNECKYNSILKDGWCHLEIVNDLTVVLFNDLPVEWVQGLTGDKTDIILTPGKHSFKVKYSKTGKNGKFPDINMVFTKISPTKFISGRSYRIFRQNIPFFIGTKTNIRIKDITPKL